MVRLNDVSWLATLLCQSIAIKQIGGCIGNWSLDVSKNKISYTVFTPSKWRNGEILDKDGTRFGVSLHSLQTNPWIFGDLSPGTDGSVHRGWTATWRRIPWVPTNHPPFFSGFSKFSVKYRPAIGGPPCMDPPASVIWIPPFSARVRGMKIMKQLLWRQQGNLPGKLKDFAPSWLNPVQTTKMLCGFSEVCFPMPEHSLCILCLNCIPAVCVFGLVFKLNHENVGIWGPSGLITSRFITWLAVSYIPCCSAIQKGTIGWYMTNIFLGTGWNYQPVTLVVWKAPCSRAYCHIQSSSPLAPLFPVSLAQIAVPAVRRNP